jgi:hypothetical protein
MLRTAVDRRRPLPYIIERVEAFKREQFAPEGAAVPCRGMLVQRGCLWSPVLLVSIAGHESRLRHRHLPSSNAHAHRCS